MQVIGAAAGSFWFHILYPNWLRQEKFWYWSTRLTWTYFELNQRTNHWKEFKMYTRGRSLWPEFTDRIFPSRFLPIVFKVGSQKTLRFEVTIRNFFTLKMLTHCTKPMRRWLKIFKVKKFLSGDMLFVKTLLRNYFKLKPKNQCSQEKDKLRDEEHADLRNDLLLNVRNNWTISAESN